MRSGTLWPVWHEGRWRHRHSVPSAICPDGLISVRALSPALRGRRARPASQRHQVIPNRPNLRLGIAAQLRKRRLRIRRCRPELRHPRAGLNAAGVAQPVENPLRLQPLVRHAQIGRQAVESADPRESLPSTWHCWHCSSVEQLAARCRPCSSARRGCRSGTNRSSSRSLRSSR